MSFCSLIQGITPKILVLCFVPVNCILLKLLCLGVSDQRHGGERERERERERESEWFIEKGRGAHVSCGDEHSQVSLGQRKAHGYNICPDKTVLRTSKALCRKVASRSFFFSFFFSISPSNFVGVVKKWNVKPPQGVPQFLVSQLVMRVSGH